MNRSVIAAATVLVVALIAAVILLRPSDDLEVSPLVERASDDGVTLAQRIADMQQTAFAASAAANSTLNDALAPLRAIAAVKLDSDDDDSASGVEIVFNALPDVTITADELTLAGDTLIFSDVAVTGLTPLVASLEGFSSQSTLLGTMTDTPELMELFTEPTDISVRMERLAIAGLTIGAAEAEAAADALGAVAQVVSGLSFERLASENMNVAVQLTTAKTPIEADGATVANEITQISQSVPFLSIDGFAGGDIGSIALREAEVLTTYETTASSEVQTLTATERVGALLWQDIRLAPIYTALRAGGLPDRTQTDIMSLGTFEMAERSTSVNGYPISAIARTMVDMSSFHWLLPTKVRWQEEGREFSLEGVLANSAISARRLAATDEDRGKIDTTFADLKAVLDEQNVDTLSMDSQGQYEWLPSSGAVEVDLQTTSERFFDIAAQSSGTLITFESIEEFPLEDDLALENAFIAALQEEASLTNLNLVVTDNGGLTTGFAVAAALAKLQPTTGLAMPEDPAKARQQVSALMSFAALTMDESLPGTGAYLQALAAFVEEGGTVTIALDPEEPLTLDAREMDETGDPAQALNRLGLSVTHEPAAVEAAAP